MGSAADWNSIREKVIARVDSSAEDLNKISQEIWSNPELNFEEHHAHKILTDYLVKEGFKVEKKFIIDTGFRATYGSDGGVNVCVICEYDALPDIGHACGHNLIAECGIGAGIAIKAGLEILGEQAGKVTVLGTPAEEGEGAKPIMIDAGVFADIDVAMMAHGCPYFISEAKFVALQPIKITFTGKSAHAAAFPWEGRNALDAAVMCYQAISVLRQQMKPDWRVHGIFTNGGVKPNIIPEEAELFYYMRAPTKVELDVLIQKVLGCIDGAAKATSCEAKHKFEVNYLDVVTNKGLISIYEKHAQNLGVTFETNPSIRDAAVGSTDMGNVSYVVPSIHPMFDINTVAPNHSREFTADAGAPTAQEPTLTQAKALALTGLELLMPGNKQLLDDIRKEFDETFGKSK
ncbi:xaa-Arg dipeptidase-like isoform X2 [Amphiura filiformis]|uniref:xaa-Arg dipeptidase-like isoform X2 n=1 Tax=Amphiura filiformis TaxID=82378 RepID=UPI003B217A65